MAKEERIISPERMCVCLRGWAVTTNFSCIQIIKPHRKKMSYKCGHQAFFFKLSVWLKSAEMWSIWKMWTYFHNKTKKLTKDTQTFATPRHYVYNPSVHYIYRTLHTYNPSIRPSSHTQPWLSDWPPLHSLNGRGIVYKGDKKWSQSSLLLCVKVSFRLIHSRLSQTWLRHHLKIEDKEDKHNTYVMFIFRLVHLTRPWNQTK